MTVGGQGLRERAGCRGLVVGMGDPQVNRAERGHYTYSVCKWQVDVYTVEHAMRRTVQRILPSQFERRLVLLGVLSTLVVMVLLVRLSVLAAGQRSRWLPRAEEALVHREYVPTLRGRILDRKGRVLAQNRSCFNVSVRYPVIVGSWAYDEARRMARQEHANVWDELGYSHRERVAAEYLPLYDSQVEQLWQTLSELGHVSPGEIQDQRQTTVRRVSRVASYLWEIWRRQETEEIDQPVPLGKVAAPISEHQAFHPMLIAVDAEGRLQVERLIAEAEASEQLRDEDRQPVHNPLAVWLQVRVERGKHREYPLETIAVAVDRSKFPGPLRSAEPQEVTVRGVGLHVIGGLRKIQREDVERRPFWPTGAPEADLGGYRPGDLTGRWGIEQSMEDVLRGLRGRVIHQLDTDRQQQTPPTPGVDVRISLDAALQARITAIMDPKLGLMKTQSWHFAGADQSDRYHQPLRGAAVVIEVGTGQVLAAVSQPGFSLDDVEKRPQWVWEDELDLPYVSRAFGRQYMPGSTVKPLVLAAAITDRKIGYHDTVTCRGAFDPAHPTRWRCWIYKMYQETHGALGPVDAIARSCNNFFAEMGRRLGAERLTWWYEQYGLARYEECGISEREQAAGHLLDLSRAGEGAKAGFSYSNSVTMGFGQGPIDWTPLQAANAYAVLARGGKGFDATFVVDPQLPTRHERDLHLDRRGAALALQGLYDAANRSYGTAHHIAELDGEVLFTLEGVRVMAKSGTADPGRTWQDINRDGKRTADEVRHWGDNAWTIVLVQKADSDRPDYAIAVLVEHGGSGGKCAGPIANQILYALRAEGYL